MRIGTRFLKWITCKVMYKVKFHHMERLDEYSTYLICPNHSSVIDPVFVFPTKYEEDVSVMAKQELFKNVLFRWLAKRYNAYAIDRENVDVRSMLKSMDVFKQNEKAKLILFPEGKVVKYEDEVGKVYKKGAAFIASHLEKPIIPVYITRRPKPFHRVHVVYGKPFFIDIKEVKGVGKMDEVSKLLIEKIYSLKGDI